MKKCIEFNNTVNSIEKDGDKWTVEASQNGVSVKHVFDAVAVCSGLFQEPNIPDFEGLSDFQGEVVHSCDYRNPQPFKGKRVLCVGLGETSSDVTAEISDVAEECTLSLRRYQVVVPTYFPFQRDPYFTLDTSPANARVPNLPLFLALQSKEYEKDTGFFKKYKKSRNSNYKIQHEWFRKSGDVNKQIITKNDRVIDHIADGIVQCNMSGIKHFKKNEVVFNDGESKEVDVIVLCTGFKLSFPFFNFKIENTRNLYKQMFLPEYGKDLALIGFARPLQGGVPAISELQARYFASLCSGESEFPSSEEMRFIADKDRMMAEKLFQITPHVSSLVNYCHYMDDIAKLIGCAPEVPPFIINPVFYIKMHLGPQFAIQYRMNGKHAKPEVAHKFIKSFSSSLHLL